MRLLVQNSILRPFSGSIPLDMDTRLLIYEVFNLQKNTKLPNNRIITFKSHYSSGGPVSMPLKHLSVRNAYSPLNSYRLIFNK